MTNEPTDSAKNATNEPTDSGKNAPNEPTDSGKNAPNEPTDSGKNAPNEPTDSGKNAPNEPTEVIEKPVASAQDNQRPLAISPRRPQMTRGDRSVDTHSARDVDSEARRLAGSVTPPRPQKKPLATNRKWLLQWRRREATTSFLESSQVFSRKSLTDYPVLLPDWLCYWFPVCFQTGTDTTSATTFDTSGSRNAVVNPRRPIRRTAAMAAVVRDGDAPVSLSCSIFEIADVAVHDGRGCRDDLLRDISRVALHKASANPDRSGAIWEWSILGFETRREALRICWDYVANALLCLQIGKVHRANALNQHNAGSKATSDYRELTKNTPSEVRQRSAFAFVTRRMISPYTFDPPRCMVLH